MAARARPKFRFATQRGDLRAIQLRGLTGHSRIYEMANHRPKSRGRKNATPKTANAQVKHILAHPKRSCRGLSLLEVVLALSLLAMASAYLAQAMNLAATNALKAERLTQAELVAESVMSQVVAGVIPAQPVAWTPYYSASQQALGHHQ